MSWLGLDIGGANLKAADGLGWAGSMPFALWRNPTDLATVLAELLQTAPSADQLAVTMTGELCDCFRTKSEGVRHILAAVERAAASRHVRVYLVDGRLASLTEAREQPLLAAASNWHALASFAGRYTQGKPGMLIDIGSTTTDIIPIVDGRPAATSVSDTDRLLAGELVYTGIGRTPVCAIVRALPWRGRRCPVAAELFATTADAYVLLGDLSERYDLGWTADGRPLTKEFARDRLARMLCADAGTFDDADAESAAESIRAAQESLLRTDIRQFLSSRSHQPEVYVLSGSGEFLARRVAIDFLGTRVSMGSELGAVVGVAAAAHALAVLARDRSNAGNSS